MSQPELRAREKANLNRLTGSVFELGISLLLMLGGFLYLFVSVAAAFLIFAGALGVLHSFAGLRTHDLDQVRAEIARTSE